MRKLLLLTFAVAILTLSAHAADVTLDNLPFPDVEYAPHAGASAAQSGTTYYTALTWTASTSAASCVSPCTFGYYVYRGTTAGGESTTALNSTPVTTTTYQDTSVSLGSTYYYVVKAVETSSGLTLTSSASNEASVTFPQVPAAATNLTATPQ